jgi:hypothetical protein
MRVDNRHRSTHSNDLAEHGVGTSDRDCMQIFDVQRNSRSGSGFDGRRHGAPVISSTIVAINSSVNTPERVRHVGRGEYLGPDGERIRELHSIRDEVFRSSDS